MCSVEAEWHHLLNVTLTGSSYGIDADRTKLQTGSIQKRHVILDSDIELLNKPLCG